MDIIKPYLTYIKIALVAILLSAAFLKGCSVQKDRDAAIIQKKDIALQAASDSLSAAASALQAQNDANKQALAHAAEALKDAQNAGVVSDARREAAEIQMKGFSKLLKNASKSLTCKAILDANVNKDCGL